MSLFSTGLPTIQARISALVVACVLPISLAATFLLYHDFAMERAHVERSTVETARALSQVVDRELTGAIEALRALSTSPYLKNGDLRSFYAQGEEILHGVQGAAFVLSDANGQELINTLRPFGSALPLHGDVARFDRVLHATQPVISDVFVGGITRQPMVAVELVVQRDGQPTYVLSLGFFSTRFNDILERQRLPNGQVIAILDHNGAIVACNRETEKTIGDKLDPVMLQHMYMSSEGTLETNMPQGGPAVISFNRSLVSGWILLIGAPRESVAGILWKSVLGSLLLLVLGLILAKYIGDQISRSIRGLVAPALALGHGNAVVVPPLQLREADDVGQALVKAAKLIEQRTAERDRAKQTAQHLGEVKRHFEYQAYHDELTGLANRVLFNQLIKSGIETCAANNERLIVFYIDMDDFKTVNDSHGHSVGDELLRQFATRLKTGLREFDVTARLGGDEFAAILMRANPAHAEATAHALIDTLSIPYHIGNLTVSTSASIGVAGYPDSATTAESLLRRADMAMYRAKTSGKRRCVVFDKSIDVDPL